jgi:putative oxidoreductase
MHNTSITNPAALLGRVLLAAIFLLSGGSKIGAYAETAAQMTKVGIPGGLLPLVIVLELVAGLLVVVGWQTRIAALALAVFTLLATYFFHFDFGSQEQTIHFLKNMAIIGGLLVLAAAGPGGWSVEGRKAT